MVGASRNVTASPATIDIDLRKCCRFITDGEDSGTGFKWDCRREGDCSISFGRYVNGKPGAAAPGGLVRVPRAPI